eukprot:scaffold184_cov125-Cylindrotheca_fusiformis.AAC.6
MSTTSQSDHHMNSEGIWVEDAEKQYDRKLTRRTSSNVESDSTSKMTTDIENPAVKTPTKAGAEPPQEQTPKPGSASKVAPTEAVFEVPSHTISFNYKPTKSPKDTLQAVYKTGEYKAALPLSLLTVQSFMAGIYIGMAGHLYLSLDAGVLGAAMFPVGLLAVILTSAELFTGDSLVFVASVLGKKVSFKKLLRNWSVSWIMNFAGCLVWASVIAYASDSLEDLHKVDVAVHVALKKAKQPWLNIFLKAIGANFMVCVGYWQATCAEEVAGKVLALWFPIASFVMLGFDHCIANQFLIPIGMMLGADISVKELLFEALLPATLGNILGGGFLVGGVYWYVFDTMRAKVHLRLPMVHMHHVNSNTEQLEPRPPKEH